MKKTTTALMMAILAFPGLAGGILVGQDGNAFEGRRATGRGHFGEGRGESSIPPGRFLDRVLELTPEQAEQVEALKEDLRATVAPLVEQRRELHQNMEDELETEAPDPTRIGEIVIASRHLGGEMQDIRASARQSFEAILTPEQLDSLETAKERGGRGFRGRSRHHQDRGF